MDTRIESDSIGSRRILSDAYYGVQSLRGAEFGAYSRAISRDILRMEHALEERYTINLGGTAIGTALNANPERCRELVDGSVGVITAICPKLGYKASADIAKTAIATGESVREVLKSKQVMSEEEINKLLDPESMV